jgi:cytochrome P450
MRWDEEHRVFEIRAFDEASAVLRGTGWSSDPRNNPLAPPEFATFPQGTLLFLDPPDHTRLRRFLSPAFTPRAVEALRPRVAAVIEAALDRIEDGTGHDTDLLADFGLVVPLAVIAELLDVGAEGAALFQEQTPALVRLLELDAGREDLTAATAAFLEITMFLVPLLAARRAAPGDDFISGLLRGDLTLDEIAATCVLLLAAGHETTANLIASGAHALMEDPSRVAALMADPPTAVEELLRLHGPVKLIARTALEHHVIDGQDVPPGTPVLLRIADANRDPRRFPHPDRLDLTRPGPAHLGFGGGAHFCLGASLARLEASEALPRLFRRFPHLKPTAAPAWRTSTTFHALTFLPVRL